MYHHGLVGLAGYFELCFKGGNLRIPIGVFVVIVESNLTDGYDLVVLEACF